MLQCNEPQEHYANVLEARPKRPHLVLFHVYEISRIGNPIETESRLVASRIWAKEGMGKCPLNGYRTLFWNNGNVLEQNKNGGCTTL